MVLTKKIYNEFSYWLCDIDHLKKMLPTLMSLVETVSEKYIFKYIVSNRLTILATSGARSNASLIVTYVKAYIYSTSVKSYQ